MPYYLYFDGVDDYLKAPSMTFTEIQMDFSFEQSNGTPMPFINSESAEVGFMRFPPGFLTGDYADIATKGDLFLNDVKQVNLSNYMPNNRRVIVRLVSSPPTTGILMFMHSQPFFTMGKIWSIKLLNGTTLQAHYDFTTGDARDKSGNNRHATVIGAIFVTDGVIPAPNAPSVTIVSQSRQKLSPIPPMDKSTLKFKFDQDVTDWAVMVLGSDYSTGTIAGSGKSVAKDAEISVDITHGMLYQEGDNRINIYGRNKDGQWTTYVV